MLDTIITAREQGRYAVIPFITAGFPTPESFWDALAQIDACGVDIIELGVPFSDPVADGPVIEAISREALSAGVSLSWLMEGLRARKGSYRAKLVLMGYVNPFLHYGLHKLAADCRELGVSGLIVPDLPLEEMPEFREALEPQGISLIPLVGPNTSSARMQQYAPLAQQYVYIVSLLGTTGSANEQLNAVADTIRRARGAFPVPLALGFGLHTPEQLLTLPEDARPDAAVIGTALLRHIREGKPVSDFFRPWMEAHR